MGPARPSNQREKLIELNRSGAEEKLKTATYIAVSGNMGSGKSSLVEFLCGRYEIQPFFEPNELNPYLDDFYLDMNRWSLHSQLYFLTAKLRMHRDLSNTKAAVIQDRTIWEDAEIFAKNLFRQTELKLRAERLGISKIEASRNGGKLEFASDTTVEPLTIVNMVQNKPQHFALEGANQLKFSFDMETNEERLQCVNQVVTQLQNQA
jgi:hypothetical protein